MIAHELICHSSMLAEALVEGGCNKSSQMMWMMKKRTMMTYLMILMMISKKGTTLTQMKNK